jgi:hypothetical protein
MKQKMSLVRFSFGIICAFIFLDCDGIIGRLPSYGNWTRPELLAAGISGGRPQIACNASGYAIIVWEQSDGTRTNIWANRYEPNAGWTSAVLIESCSGNANYPQITLNYSGQAVAVWQQYDGARNNICANQYVPGAGWGPEMQIESSSRQAGNPCIAMNKRGKAITVWEEYDGSGFCSSWSNCYITGTGWGTPIQIQTTLADAERPQVALDNGGNAISVWKYWDGTRTDSCAVCATYYTPNIGWDNPKSIGNGSTYATKARIIFDNYGNAISIWDGYDVNVNHFYPGTGWISSRGLRIGSGRSPQIAINKTNEVIVVWQNSDIAQTQYSIYSNRYDPRSGWGKAELIETVSGVAENPQSVIDDRGNAMVVWSQSDGARKSIWANFYAAGYGWNGAKPIGEGLWGDMTDPQVAVDGKGTVIAVWAQNNGAQFALWASRFVLGR